MSFCFVIDEVNANYIKAQNEYSRKKDKILKALEREYDVSGEKFFSTLKEEYNQLISQKMVSPTTGREGKYETILKHLYSAAEKKAISILNGDTVQLNEEKDRIQQIQKDAQLGIKEQHELINKEIDRIVKQYAEKTNIDNLLEGYLPQFISQDNKKLAADQVMGYYKKVLKAEAIKQLDLNTGDKKINKYTAITLGYIKEDAMSTAGTNVIEKLGLHGATARTVGAEKSHIDILISLPGNISVQKKTDFLLKDLLQKLDTISQSIIEIGESKYDTDQFLGIQSKPWNIYRPESKYYKMAVGYRGSLLSEYKELIDNNGVEYPYSWHSGVLFLSKHLEEVLGANTVLYVINNKNNSLTWTDELLGNLLHLQKYFAFDLDQNHHITAMVVINQHEAHNEIKFDN